MEIVNAKNITIRLSDQILFQNHSITLQSNRLYVFFGPNGAGKTTLAKALAGKLPIVQGEYVLPNPKDVAFLSFETHEKLAYRLEQEEEWQSFSNKVKKTTVRNFLNNGTIEQWSNTISQLLSKPLSILSNGELRTVLLNKKLQRKPELFILDEPFEGLDEISRKAFAQMIEKLTNQMTIILITHRIEEIPKTVHKIFLIEKGRIEKETNDIASLPSVIAIRQKAEKQSQEIATSSTRDDKKMHIPLVVMKNVTVQYGKQKILDNISWQMNRGENWLIVGPNGAGKTTLTELITGDNLQSYANDIQLFGKRKDESNLWDIRQKISVVSPELQLQQESLPVNKIIASGLFDTIGLYQKLTKHQKEHVMTVAKRLGVEALLKKDYSHLSQGQKRIVLIARALVKQPQLLILDEPLSSLDQKNKQKIMHILHDIGISGKTNLIFITHHKEEILPCITHVLQLSNGKVTEATDIQWWYMPKTGENA